MKAAARSLVGNIAVYDTEGIVLSNPPPSPRRVGVDTLSGLSNFVSVTEAPAKRGDVDYLSGAWPICGSGIGSWNASPCWLDECISVDDLLLTSASSFAKRIHQTFMVGVPPVLLHVNNSLSEFTELLDGWDSYDGKPTDRVAAANAAAWFATVYKHGMPMPQIVPGADGSVQLEWHIANIHIEVLFSPNRKSEYSVEDDATDEIKEGPVSFDGNSDLDRALGRITRDGGAHYCMIVNPQHQ